MSYQTLSSARFRLLRVPALTFTWAFTVGAMAAPILLVTYAFMISPDSVARAQMVVQGCERVVFFLAAALTFRAFYILGVKTGSSYATTASGVNPQGMAA